MTTKRLPLHPKRPERVCWGCDQYCSSADLGCGNGTERTPHPSEIFGDDWLEFELARSPDPGAVDPAPTKA